jgi:hypothetical protein
MNFDVFLSHNSKDKPAVKALGAALQQRGLSVWLDEWELRPGLTWRDALADIVTGCKSAIVCIGGSGVGPWEDPEMQALLRRFVNDKRIGNIVPIIPVLLPGAPTDVKLPLFLEAFTWVDLRNGLTADGLERLRWGITGEKSRENAATVPLSSLAKMFGFLSYARADSEQVLPIAKQLREAGARLWLDQLDIVRGEYWDRAVEEALQTCDCLVVMLSPAAVRSENVMDEVAYAIEKGKRIVPVLLESCEIPLRLRRRQHIDLTRRDSAALHAIADAISPSRSG